MFNNEFKSQDIPYPPRIIIIDWDESIMQNFNAILDDKCKFVNSMEQGLDLLSIKPYEIMFVNIMMAGMNGIEFMNKVLEIKPDIKIIIIKDHCADLRLEDSMKLNIFGYLEKPILEKEILKLISKVWNKMFYDMVDNFKVSKLIKQAFYDPLTKLPNRGMFMDKLSTVFEQYKEEEDRRFSILFVDLDKFKTINDVYGHVVGDNLLVAVADRLRKSLKLCDVVCRFGGDEFTIILEDIKKVENVIKIVERLIVKLGKPYEIRKYKVSTTISVGVSISYNKYDKYKQMLHDADKAMYLAKSKGGNCFEISNNNSLKSEARLTKAFQNNEFHLFYQPAFALDPFELCGFEALMRWLDKDGKYVMSPVEFIPLLEKTGLISEIGDWALQKACRAGKEFNKLGDYKIAVNFSAKQFEEQEIFSVIKNALKISKLPIDRLIIEITESLAMKNVEFTISTLKKISKLGVRISIDDFGTGYSSLSYLSRFPIDNIKIDKSFLFDVINNETNKTLIKSIIAMSNSLGLKTIAEGVETEEQFKLLKKIECTAVQGFLLGKPLSFDDTIKFIKNYNEKS